MKERECFLYNNIITPVYAQIALDIAMRIARGDLKENTKVYGRSVMSSEYGVSPETIRRSMKLLEDMNIVETKQNSGTIILSAENAKLYVEKFGTQSDIHLMQKKLSDLIKNQEDTNRKIVDTVDFIVRTNDKISESNPFHNFQIMIPKKSAIIGHTLAEMNFWQETRATVIAIRRAGNIILSPGPYILFQENDSIIFVGDITCVQVVNDFVNK
jgi:K+/H+ antiporter YhaU regulatory subunit KhtT